MNRENLLKFIWFWAYFDGWFLRFDWWLCSAASVLMIMSCEISDYEMSFDISGDPWLLLLICLSKSKLTVK